MKRSASILILGTVFLSGCLARPSSYFRSQETTPYSRVKVALIPFTNLSAERGADQKITYSLITHLLRSDYFEVVTMGETQKAMKDLKISRDEDLSIEQIKKMGAQTGADVLFMGVVDEFKIDSNTVMGEKVFVPEVSLSARLVSTRDGSIIWSANHHRRGDDRVMAFGMGRIDSISDLSDIVVSDLSRSLVSAARKKGGSFMTNHKKDADAAGAADAESLEAKAQAAGIASEIDRLKRENVSLQNKLEALKKEGGQEAPLLPQAETSSLTVSVTSVETVALNEAAASSSSKAAVAPKQADPRKEAKDQFQQLFQDIKKQY